MAHAQPAPPAVVPVPLQDLPSDDGVIARAERLWSGVMDSFGIGFARPAGRSRAGMPRRRRTSRRATTSLG